MTPGLLHAITDFGDAAVTLPLLLLIALFLASRTGRTGWRRHAGWSLAIGGAFAAILVLKLVFGMVPALGIPIDVRSPSGHTATAAASYGGLAILLFGRTTGICAAALVALVIGATRVALDMHTLPEVAIGGAVGIGAVLLLGTMSRMSALPRREAMLLFALTGALVALDHGQHAAIEPRLQHIEVSMRL